MLQFTRNIKEIKGAAHENYDDDGTRKRGFAPVRKNIEEAYCPPRSKLSLCCSVSRWGDTYPGWGRGGVLWMDGGYIGSWVPPPPVNRQTDPCQRICQNIIFLILRMRVVIIGVCAIYYIDFRFLGDEWWTVATQYSDQTYL